MAYSSTSVFLFDALVCRSPLTHALANPALSSRSAGITAVVVHLQKKEAPQGAWRYMGTLVRSQTGILLTSLATLVLAAACEVAVPHYMSRALNAAAFAQDRLVSKPIISMSFDGTYHPMTIFFFFCAGGCRRLFSLTPCDAEVLCATDEPCCSYGLPRVVDTSL